MSLLAEYTGGSNGWGTLIYKCSFCGEIVAEYTTDDNGNPMIELFDDSETHVCGDDE